MNKTASAHLASIPPQANVTVIQLTGWITKELYIQTKGMSDGKIRGKIQRNVWKKGVHYIIDERCTWLNIEAIEQWLNSKSIQPASGQVFEAASKFDGSLAASHIQNTSTTRRHRHI